MKKILFAVAILAVAVTALHANYSAKVRHMEAELLKRQSVREVGEVIISSEVERADLTFHDRLHSRGDTIEVLQPSSLDVGRTVLISKNTPYKIECGIYSGIIIVLGTGEHEEVVEVYTAKDDQYFTPNSPAGRKLYATVCESVSTMYANLIKGDVHAQ